MIDAILNKFGLIREKKALEIVETEVNKTMHTKYGQWLRLINQVHTRLEKGKAANKRTKNRHNYNTALGITRSLAKEFTLLHKKTRRKGRR